MYTKVHYENVDPIAAAGVEWLTHCAPDHRRRMCALVRIGVNS